MHIAFLQWKNYGSEEQMNNRQGLVVKGREVVVTYDGNLVMKLFCILIVLSIIQIYTSIKLHTTKDTPMNEYKTGEI